MIRKWLRNGVLALAFLASGTGALLPAAYARDASLPLYAAQTEAHAATGPAASTVAVTALPREAVRTLDLIGRGGAFPYPKDGMVFGNFERMLPRQARGFYREYTVPTPYARNRGARRIVCGGPPRSIRECYYTDDHYANFKRIVG
jgi:ribonuclease T1